MKCASQFCNITSFMLHYSARAMVNLTKPIVDADSAVPKIGGLLDSAWTYDGVNTKLSFALR